MSCQSTLRWRIATLKSAAISGLNSKAPPSIPKHLHHLAAASHQFREGLAVGVSERTCIRSDALCEQSDGLSVERVGFEA